MDKKEYLQKILTQLEPIRDLAKWLRILVEEWNLWDNVLDVIKSKNCAYFIMGFERFSIDLSIDYTSSK